MKRFNPLAVLLAAVMALGITGSAFANAELLELQEDPAQFVMPNGNYSGNNYSALDQINRDNVADLQVAWTFQTGVSDQHEAQPLVVGSTMFILTPKPNSLIALDLENEGAILWSFTPDMDTDRAGAMACCGAQSRGAAYADGRIFFTTLDAQLFSLDAQTGEVLWQTVIADLDIYETTPGNPLLVDNLLIIGTEGGDRSVRGRVAAYDIDTGEQVWNFFNTGSDQDMGITDRFQPFYADDQVEEPGLSTWYGDSWEIGGGTAWGWFTYDPDLNLVYYGTSNCSPWNADYRRDPMTAPGYDTYHNKYCASLVARDVTTGEMVWAHSHTPQDSYDYDEPGQNILADLEIDGEERRVIIKPARNGWFYVFDAATGEIVNEPFAYTTVNWASHIDLETGRPVIYDTHFSYTGHTFDICPFISGNNVENDSYSPNTGLVYFMAENVCSSLGGIAGEFTPGEYYLLMEFGQNFTGEGGWMGELQAWDPVTGEKVWGVQHENSKNLKPVFSTGGDLVFRGTDQGLFVAHDALTGEELWSFRTGSDFKGPAMSYVGPDGNQYIAIVASSGPTAADIGPDTPADAAARYSRPGGTLYVFGLP